jgi:uncharacterized protein (DUF305 family)
MKTLAIALSALAIAAAGATFAQTQPDAHGHGAGAPATGTGPMPMRMMENMPEECRTMMQAMPETCRSAMQGMMRGGPMMQGHAAATPQEQSAATRAYVEAMDRMHGPMMEGAMEEDPDTAFVKGMIPHHQGAIEMAKVVQQYGDDEQTREWAARIIEVQQAEIAEMEEWLKKNAK